MRRSRAKPVGTFRIYAPATRHVGAHVKTLREARKDAAYFLAAGAKKIEIQERFPSGQWITIEEAVRFKI